MRIQTTVEIKTQSANLANDILREFKGKIHNFKSDEFNYIIKLKIEFGKELPDNLEELNNQLTNLKKQ